MKLFFPFLFCISTGVFAQNDLYSPKKELNAKSTKEALDSAHLSPLVFLGQIAVNPANNNLELNLADEKAKLQGVLYRSRGGKILSVDVSGENENQTLAIFSGTKVNPKVKGTLSLTVPMKSWVSYQLPDLGVNLDTLVQDSLLKIKDEMAPYFEGKRQKIEANYLELQNKGGSESRAKFLRDDALEKLNDQMEAYYKRLSVSLKYNMILEDVERYKVKRKNYSFMTLGLTGEGAKYNLFDSLKTTSFIVKKEKYTGWNTFAQYNLLNYHLTKQRMTVHSFRGEFGELNNIDDLTEYSYTEITSNPAGSQKLERKLTGYIDPYFTQNKAVLSYELNRYPMDSLKRQIGFLFGTDFTYYARSSNQMNFHVGLNFPVLVKGSSSNPPLYISAILGTVDTFNWAEKDDFFLKNNLLFVLRFARPLFFNYTGNH